MADAKKVFYSIGLTENCKIKVVGTDGSTTIYGSVSDAGFGNYMVDDKLICIEDILSPIPVEEFIEAQCACVLAGGEVEPPEPVKEFKEYLKLCHKVDDPKCENPIVAALYTLNGVPCVFDCEDTDLETPLNIKDYNIMNIQGVPIPENLAALTESACIDICIPVGTALTEADILALFVADGVLLPDGTAPTGFVNASVAVKYAGQQAKDAAGVKKKLVSGFCIEVNGDVVNSGTTYCDPREDLIDADCDKFVRGEALSIENTGTTDGAVRVCAELAPVDADDADVAVQ